MAGWRGEELYVLSWGHTDERFIGDFSDDPLASLDDNRVQVQLLGSALRLGLDIDHPINAGCNQVLCVVMVWEGRGVERLPTHRNPSPRRVDERRHLRVYRSTEFSDPHELSALHEWKRGLNELRRRFSPEARCKPGLSSECIEEFAEHRVLETLPWILRQMAIA